MELKDNKILVMKIGFHGDESLQKIIERKNQEVAQFGRTFWGYGGVLCHPSRVVQPFSANSKGEGGVRVLFSVTPSPFESSDVEPLSHMSEDGISWSRLPAGAIITASRFALVIGKIEPIEGAHIDMAQYSVANGPSAGRSLKDYLRFRVDKAVAQRIPAESVAPSNIAIGFTASLLAPYAIWVGREPPPSFHQDTLPLP